MESLVSRAWLALEVTQSQLVVCGGVAANGRLRRALKKQAQATGAGFISRPLTFAPTTPPWLRPWAINSSNAASA